jgi:pimeloyl-ACP methyl ester carboxylesterase
MLNHVRRGAGEPLVLVHGTGSRHEVWEPVLDRLAVHHEVIAPDLPGFGESPRLSGPTTVATLADALQEFLAQVGVERPHVAGNSLGGWITLELAQRGGARSAIPLSPSGFGSARERRFMDMSLRVTRRVAELIAPYAEAIMATAPARTVLLAQLFGRPWRMPAAHAVHAIRGVVHASAFHEIRAYQATHTYEPKPIAVPVTIGWGVRDALLLPRQGRRAERLIPGSRLVPLPGCGHVPTWDDPALVAQVILDGAARATYPASHLVGR